MRDCKGRCYKEEERPFFGLYLVLNKAGRAVIYVLLITAPVFLLLSAPGVSAARYGDVNGDGRIDVRDVALVTRHVLGMSPLSGAGETLADVNADGVVNVRDISLLMQKSLGLIDEFPGRGKLETDLVEKVIVAEGISPGSSIVIVILEVPDPGNYRVEIGGNVLEYSESTGAFVGEVSREDAVEDKVAVYRL